MALPATHPLLIAGVPVTRESMLARWQRRAFTLPLFILMTVLATAIFPFAFLLAVVVDALRPRRMVLTRSALFFTGFLWLETLGLVTAALAWLLTLRWLGLGTRAFVAANELLQVWWNRALFALGSRAFSMRLVVENPEVLAGDEPLVVLPRHVSTVDTVLPIRLLSSVGRRSFRFVLKHQLLADPCLDVVGNRLPNHFARRGLDDNAEEIAAVRGLAGNLGPRESVVIFPEGGRFTAQRRAALLERLQSSGRGEQLELARALQHTLPPLTEGTLALLETARNADVLVVGHAGLEQAGGFPDFIRGALVGLELRVRLWRIPAADMGTSRADRAAALARAWRAVDAFIHDDLARRHT